MLCCVALLAVGSSTGAKLVCSAQKISDTRGPPRPARRQRVLWLRRYLTTSSESFDVEPDVSLSSIDTSPLISWSPGLLAFDSARSLELEEQKAFDRQHVRCVGLLLLKVAPVPQFEM